MSLYTLRRLLTAAARGFVTYYAATAGERLAKKHIRLPTTKRRTNRRTTKRKNK